MWIVWAVSTIALAILAGCVFLMRRELRSAPWSWRILAVSGLPLALGGLGFILRFWEPTPGPYQANVLYPLGPYLNAWAVSFGFMWVAFGLAFFALTLLAPRGYRLWIVLFLAWLLAWVPHGIIGIGFALAGSNQPSIAVYRGWASTPRGFMHLLASALILLTHFALALGGFMLTARRHDQFGNNNLCA